MTPAESLSASMTPVKPVGTLLIPVELVSAPTMPFEPERNDTCTLIASLLLVTRHTSASPQGVLSPPPTYILPFLGHGPLWSPDQTQSYGWCAGALGTALS